MKYMTSDEIREAYLKFFETKGHKRLPSASLIPDDPQLMFTVAGMVPFKPIFWGKVDPIYPRVTTCQKCVRTNDIENVGRTPRHHTFFEMLGNFSFGDYFKKEAIAWAWEFVTKVLEMPEEKLWVTIYEYDDESFEIWKSIGVPEYKIIRMGKEDNFWGPAGPTGPCGPCSEIHYDTGIEVPVKDGGTPNPGNTDGRFIEIWNLVFTEFYQDEEGKLHPLPRKNIDTGAGLERISAMMQGVLWNFDTDLFKPIIDTIQNVLNVKYKEDPKKDVSIRVIADHVRAVTFMIGDGVLPSNEGRGYVLRRVLRRALRHGALLGAKEPFLYKIVDSVVKKMGHVYPEIVEKQSFVETIIKAEEQKFITNLSRGLELVQKIVSASGKISAEDAFKLYDTYGFPIDILRDIAQENNYELDEAGFEKYLQQQRERSRKAQGEVEFAQKTGYETLDLETVFVGYDTMESESTVLKIKKDNEFVEELETEGMECELVLDITPFYAEKGGQVADRGTINWSNGRFEVEYVYNPVEGIIVHKGKLYGKIKVGEKILSAVDEKRRWTMRNHTATHLLHAALRKVLGTHVRQAGSLVEPERLRFDFTHYQALTKEEIKQIEDMVNEVILQAIPVVTEVKSYDEAVKEGAMALFEEKYGDFVRVVKVADFSEELCGGTHVRNTGEIGLFKIISESAVSAGVRRIEAITGMNSLEYLRNRESILESLKERLEVPMSEISVKVEKIIEEKKALEKELASLKIKLINPETIASSSKSFEGINYLSFVFDSVEPEVLKDLTDDVSERIKGIVLLISKLEGKIVFTIKVPKELTSTYNAGNIAKAVAKVLGGGGGGSPTFAQAGGKLQEKIPEALELFEKIIRREVQ
ncbi:MAG: alanine--tRNA ligase [Fervidobacterium sp.]|uniref:Alanine--tRNA ligase n=1 Tax=Fervidobacterium gondwanense DSM 13020 TaxID=1121883 RepID=A0A1M7RTK3_FERGO|nr:alanine--tRNA ligase [Fervidobacterium gondwanense]SHN49667.1 alanyl-tRNA synthetase [Fervidobacterium gondwanense DSM 13020]